MVSSKSAFWKSVWFVMVSAVLVSFVARAGWEYEYCEGKKVKIGADIRLRLTHYDDNVGTPESTAINSSSTPNEYLRNRTRIWANVDITEDVEFNVTLANRFHHYSSRAGDNNTNPGTWQFPDEVIFDALNVKFKNIMDSGLSVTLGRQNVILGNGMVVLEGTPRDQGRTIYFDGITAAYKTECDTITAFALYMDYKDQYVVFDGRDLDDEGRVLRSGDVATYGMNWTHNYTSLINTDVYYIYSDIDHPPTTKGVPGAATDTGQSTMGGRLFGNLTEATSYSIEAAKENGHREDRSDLDGMLADVRLTTKLGDDVPLNPVLGLQYTFLSGDDPDTYEFEGWVPVYAQYPIWREELLPIMLRGNWTNLHQYRGQVVLQLMKNVKFTGAYAHLRVDEERTALVGGEGMDGKTMGNLLSGFVDVGVGKHLKFSFEASAFYPGNYWNDGNSSEWLRFQTVYTF